ncbi:MAG: hypothetical protein RLZZ251_285 [Actinomycetota bacterium]|jgi:predicted dehydrogenase
MTSSSTSGAFRWGIIGPGKIAKTFAADITTYTSQTVAAVGSRDLSRAQEFATKFGALAYGSYEEVVLADVDAIYVATPHQLHADNSILALRAGKPVLCEKPFAATLQQATEMVKVAREKKLLLMEGMWSRYLPHYAIVRELIANNEIGEVIHIQADHGQYLRPENYIRHHSPESAGGALLDLGVYPISLTTMLLGRPHEIKAVATLTPRGVDDTTSIALRFHSGAHALLTTTFTAKTPCTATIVGSHGVIEISGDFYTPQKIRLQRRGKDEQIFESNYVGHGIREQALYFQRTLEDGRQESEILDLDHSLMVMAMMDEIRQQIGVRYPFE